MRNGDRGVWMHWSEAATSLEVSSGQVLLLIESGQLPSEETSAGILLVRRADVERLRDAQREARDRRAARHARAPG